MAANKFATMVHRNTNKITLILIYAVLEWTLIVLLLLNSLFSYLIIKFSEYFGLKPPCLWCSRVDHIFEPGNDNNNNNKNMHRDLLCELHAAEVSKLGYCSIHRKLAESQDMCEDCLSSRPDLSGEKPTTKNLALFPLMKELGMIQSLGGDKVVVENGSDVNFIKCCSCCGVNLDSHVYSPYILIKPSWDVLGYSKKNINLISEVGKDDDSVQEDGILERCGSDVSAHQWEFGLDSVIKNEEEEVVEDGYFSVSISEKRVEEEDMGKERESSTIEEKSSKMVMKDQSVQVSVGKDDSSFEVLPQHLEFFFDCTGNRLVPFELIDSATDEDQNIYKISSSKEKEEENQDETNVAVHHHHHHHQEVILGGDKQSKEDKKASLQELQSEEERKSKYAAVVLESMEMEEDENSLVFHAKECPFDQHAVTQDRGDLGAMETAEREEKNSDSSPVSEDGHQVTTATETDAEVSIGTEIPDLDATDDIQTRDIIFSYEECNPEDPSTSSACCFDLHGTEEEEEEQQQQQQQQQQTIELKGLSLEPSEDVALNQSSFSQEMNGNEEDKVPDTPTSVDSLNSLHKKFLQLEKKDSGTEESLDGSIISEMEGGDAAMTVEHLKSALRNERKTLQALYAELEEERSASAVAANQTMAMINRLQEEKAQMQMEALQYQRMMEEQSEYDQEALQLLNELMVKREKEKQELEKEMEIYRRKVLEYETKEKMRLLRKSKDGSGRSGFSSASASCSNAEDSDGISIDLNQEVKEEESFYSHQECSSNHNNTPVDTVLNLEDSLADFEEERLSILEQLKALEEKLMHLDEEDEQHFEDVIRSPEHHFPEQNGNHVKENGHVNGEANGYNNSKEINGKYHQERRIMGSKGKSLLPLFDATEDDEIGDIMILNNGNGFNHHDSNSNGLHHHHHHHHEFDDIKNLDVEEEVDHIYERLQALEADREFLKHCISSLKKGDKGMDLLQEILQHLRDLRNVENRAKNFSDGNTV